MHYDLPLAELRGYHANIAAPPSLEAFWSRTLSECAGTPIDVEFREVDTPLALLRTFDVTFGGFQSQPIKAWLRVPANSTAALPTVVEFRGYNGGRGLAHETGLWPLAGFAHFVMDTRGQGSGWSRGDTADPGDTGEPAQGGFVTRGISHPDTYYYRRVFVDAIRAVEAAACHPLVAADQVAVAGSSQGGGIAIAVSALAQGVRACMADVPFLCHFERAVRLVDSDAYIEITRYLKIHRDRAASVFDTLRFFDGVVLARLATVPALFSVALMDQICPPSTVFAAFNAYGGADKTIEVYEFNDHEGGEGVHEAKKIDWLCTQLRAGSVMPP